MKIYIATLKSLASNFKMIASSQAQHNPNHFLHLCQRFSKKYMIKRYMCINIELSLEFGHSLQRKSIISKHCSGGVHYIVCYSDQHFIVNEQRVFGQTFGHSLKTQGNGRQWTGRRGSKDSEEEDFSRRGSYSGRARKRQQRLTVLIANGDGSCACSKTTGLPFLSLFGGCNWLIAPCGYTSDASRHVVGASAS